MKTTSATESQIVSIGVIVALATLLAACNTETSKPTEMANQGLKWHDVRDLLIRINETCEPEGFIDAVFGPERKPYFTDDPKELEIVEWMRGQDRWWGRAKFGWSNGKESVYVTDVNIYGKQFLKRVKSPEIWNELNCGHKLVSEVSVDEITNRADWIIYEDREEKEWERLERQRTSTERENENQ